MDIVTTTRGLILLFAGKCGVQPRLPRKILRHIRRENKHAQYRVKERARIVAAKRSEQTNG